MTQTHELTENGTPRGSARDHILATAKRLFAERGYDGVSIADVARESDVSKANIFHHFESKERLYLAVIAHVIKNAPDQAQLLDDDRDIVTRFQDLAAAELREGVNDEQGVRLILQEIISGSPMRSRVLAEEVFADRFTKMIAFIRDQQEAGLLRADMDPALAATVLRSVTAFFLLSRNVMRHMPGVTFADDPEHYAREVARLVMRGLLSESETGKR